MSAIKDFLPWLLLISAVAILTVLFNSHIGQVLWWLSTPLVKIIQ